MGSVLNVYPGDKMAAAMVQPVIEFYVQLSMLVDYIRLYSRD